MKQKSQSLFLLLWVLAIVTGCSPALDDSPPSDAQAPVMPLTEVIRQGEKIIYSGPLTAEANRTVKSLLDEHTHILAISSRGGEINLGMDLGELVIEHGLSVEVVGYCLSSCANYVLPAGRLKLLHRDSLVAWHGGAFQTFAYIDPAIEPAFRAYIEPAKLRERAYFEKLAISPHVTVMGQRDDYADRGKGCMGWTYSVDTMAALGMRNITLLDGEWNPPLVWEGRCVFLIDQFTDSANKE